MKVLQVHFSEGFVSQYAGVIYEDIKSSVGIDGCLHNARGSGEVRHTVLIRCGFAAFSPDLIDKALCNGPVIASTLYATSRIIACVRPRPPPAPVTTATRFSRLIDIRMSLHDHDWTIYYRLQLSYPAAAIDRTSALQCYRWY